MSTAIKRALYGKMAGDTLLAGTLLAAPAQGFSKAIYYGIAPAGAPYPHIIFNKQSGVPTEAFTDPSAFETDIWLIKAVDRNTTADRAESVKERVATLLNDGTLSISGGTLMYLRRQSDVEFSEFTDNQQYYTAGSNYRVIYDATS